MAKEYIDRESLFKAIRCVPMSAVVPDLDDTKVYHAVVGQGQAIKEIILAQPVADVAEVRHGEWKHAGDDDWRCTNCNDYFRLDVDMHPIDDCGMNYCPNCGAKMDGKVGAENV